MSALVVVVKLDCALPPATRLTLTGLSTVDNPLGDTGNEEAARLTVPANPPKLNTVTGRISNDPSEIEKVGPASISTSGDAAGLGHTETRRVLIQMKPLSISVTMSRTEKLSEKPAPPSWGWQNLWVMNGKIETTDWPSPKSHE